MNYLSKIGLPLFAIFVLAFSGCKDNGFRKDISEGVIEYHVTYPDVDSNDIMRELLPDKMILKFKKDRFKTELSAGAGLVETNFISNSRSYTLMSLVKFLGDRYALVMDSEGAKNFNSSYPAHTIVMTDETKEVAGVTCKKAIIDFGTSGRESLFFYYTEDIQLNEPNWSNPFSDIGGVLLDYEMENYDMRMHLTAISITEEEIDDDEFELPDNYIVLQFEEFQDKVIKNLEAFNEH